jgi:hypothetical protein
MGLEPLVDNKDYFQYLTLLRSRLEETNRFEFRRGDSPLKEVGVLREDFFPAILSASGRVTAALVFAGYGITAPELKLDEYENMTTAGKIAVLFSGVPDKNSEGEYFGARLRSDHRTDLYKILNAQDHGAVGVILVHEGERGSFSRKARSTWPENESNGRFIAQFDVDRIRIPAIYCAANKISSLLGKKEDLESLKREIDQQWMSRSRPLGGVEVTIETAIARNEHRVRNVVALLPGSDPTLKDETVVISAHFDHIGKGADRIYNGADDDASGTAGVLEIAEAFAEVADKPKRSLIFALWNAEERGLFGSRYYTEQPPVALSETVALLQLDMIGRNQEVDNPADNRFRGLEMQTAEENENTLHIVGYTHSTDLKDLACSANESIDLDLLFELDEHPLNLIRRSDHWPFLLVEVPALLLTTGFHPDYHTANDTADKLNYPKMERIVRLTFLLAWNLAHSESRPRLNQIRCVR